MNQYDQLADLLDAYADARLSPRSPVLSRIRSHVLSHAEATIAAEREPSARPKPALVQFLRPWRRRIVAIGLAAAVMVGSSAVVLAAPAGSPLYDARVLLETAMLPGPAQPDQRLLAQERHIEERLAEAEAAANRGDVNALAAALAAYQSAVDDAVAELRADPDLLAHLESELAKHTAVLEALAARLPDQSSIEHAIDASQKAAQKLHDRPKPHPTPRGPGG